MTLVQFNLLSDRSRHTILNTKAVFIAIVSEGYDSYTLFQLDGFYIEVFCCGGENCQASTINYFEDTFLLDPYLELVNIDSIYEILSEKRKK